MPYIVIPAQAGIQGSSDCAAESWIPAFAGMTREIRGLRAIVTVDEVDSRFDELVDLAELGEEIVITRDGKEVGRLIPPRHYETEPEIAKRGFSQ